MKRVSAIKPAGASGAITDRVVLDADERQRRRIVLTSENGRKVLLDFPSPVTLRDGDALVLEDGSLIAVTGRAEPLIEVSAKTAEEFVRVAWHIGNRHTDVQFVEKALRIRQDHVLEEMVQGLGGIMKPVEASFDPKPAMPHHHE